MKDNRNGIMRVNLNF